MNLENKNYLQKLNLINLIFFYYIASSVQIKNYPSKIYRYLNYLYRIKFSKISYAVSKPRPWWIFYTYLKYKNSLETSLNLKLDRNVVVKMLDIQQTYLWYNFFRKILYTCQSSLS
jgi:hypothetical protein